MKKIVSLFLACLMVLSIGMIPAFATTEKAIVCTVAEESLTVDTKLEKSGGTQPYYAGTVQSGNNYPTENGVMVRKDVNGNVYFEIAADTKNITSSGIAYYEHKLAILDGATNGAKDLKRFTAKINLPSVDTAGQTIVFAQQCMSSMAGTSRAVNGFGVRLTNGEAQYYDKANSKYVNFLNEGVTLSANTWYTIEAVMDARAAGADGKTYMNAFVYDSTGALIGKSGWQYVQSGKGTWTKTWYTTQITACGYAAGSKVLADEFKGYILSDLPAYTYEEPTSYKNPVTITENYTNNYITATTASSWQRTVGEKFNNETSTASNRLGDGSKNKAARYNMSFRIPEFGSSFYFIDFITGASMQNDSGAALDGVAKVDSTGAFIAKDKDGNAVSLSNNATSYQLAENTWYNLEALVDYSTFDTPKATVYLKDAKGNVLAQSAQQYTVARIPTDTGKPNWCKATLMWVGIGSTSKYIHFDNTKSVIAPSYDELLADTNLTVVNEDDFEAHAVETTYKNLLKAGVEGTTHVTDSTDFLYVNNAKVAVEQVSEQVSVVKDVEFSFAYDNAVANSNINYDNIKLLNGEEELVGGVDYIITPANDGGIDGAETSKNFTVEMPKLRADTTYTLRLMADVSDYNIADTAKPHGARLGLPADNGLYKDFTFTTPSAATETTIVSSLVDADGAEVTTLAKDAVIKGKVAVTNNDAEALNGYVILAVYEGTELVTAKISDAFSIASGAENTAETEAVTLAKDGLTAKVFVWNNLSELKPLTDAAIIPAA